MLHMAADSGDEHAIKFADTAADSFHRTGDPAVVATANQAVAQIAAD